MPAVVTPTFGPAAAQAPRRGCRCRGSIARQGIAQRCPERGLGRHMGVLRRRTQLGMAEQNLDHAHIRSRLQKMRREAVAQTMQRAARLLDPGQVLGCTEGAMELPG